MGILHILSNVSTSKRSRLLLLLSRVWLFVTPRTVAHQAPLSMGFLRQENWSGLPFPSPGDLLKPGIKPVFPALVGILFSTELAGKPKRSMRKYNAFHRTAKVGKSKSIFSKVKHLKSCSVVGSGGGAPVLWSPQCTGPRDAPASLDDSGPTCPPEKVSPPGVCIDGAEQSGGKEAFHREKGGQERCHPRLSLIRAHA